MGETVTSACRCPSGHHCQRKKEAKSLRYAPNESFLLLAFTLAMASSMFGVANCQGGYWSTNGSRIVDSKGNQVTFSGVNWMGFDSENFAPHGLYSNSSNYTFYLDEMQRLGFNLIRLAFCGEMFKDPNQMPMNINYTANPGLKGLNVLGLMDEIVAAAGKRGIRIILDYHRITAGSKPEWGLWYNDDYPEDYWVKTWVSLAGRYAGNSTVVGVDLFNEIHDDISHKGPTWSPPGQDPGINWRDAVIRVGNAIQAVNPDVLICVQGLPYSAWWAEDLIPMANLTVNLTIPNKVVYEIHDYGPIVFPQPWHIDSAFPDSLPAFWYKNWGFMVDGNIAPVWIGEWGSSLNASSPHYATEMKWVNALHDYIKARNLPYTWFMWTPNSGDTGGILMDDYKTPDQNKLAILADIMYPNFQPRALPPTPPPVTSPPPVNGTSFGDIPPPSAGVSSASAFARSGPKQSWLLVAVACFVLFTSGSPQRLSLF